MKGQRDGQTDKQTRWSQYSTSTRVCGGIIYQVMLLHNICAILLQNTFRSMRNTQWTFISELYIKIKKYKCKWTAEHYTMM